MNNFFEGSKVIELSPDYFYKDSPGKINSPSVILVLFYAPWCGHCATIKPIWKNLAETQKEIPICAIDCHKYSKYLTIFNEEWNHSVRGFPTILIYKDHKPFEKYEGKRNGQDILDSARRLNKLN